MAPGPSSSQRVVQEEPLLPEVATQDGLVTQVFSSQKTGRSTAAVVTLLDLHSEGSSRLEQKEKFVLEISAPQDSRAGAADSRDILREIIGKGLEAGGGAGLALIEKAARELGLEASVSIPSAGIQGLAYGHLAGACRRLEDRLASDLLDGLTGLRTRSLFSSSRDVAALNARLSGPKILFTLDFDHVRIADRFGFGRELEEVFRSLHRCAAEAFQKSGMPCEVVRLGGDEFGVLVGGCNSRVMFRQGLQKFMDLVGIAREEAFSRVDQKPDGTKDFEKACRGALLREHMRALRKEFGAVCKERADFTLAGYKNWLLQRSGAISVPQEATTGALELALALKAAGEAPLKRADTARLMGFTVSDVIILGGRPAPEDYSRALGQADRSIKPRKGVKSFPQTVLLDSQIEERQSSKEARRRQDELEQGLRSGLAEFAVEEKEGRLSLIEKFDFLREKLLLWASDPSQKSGLGRFNYLADVLQGDVLGIDKPRLYAVVEKDIIGFSSFNLEGEERADAVFGRLVLVGHSELGGALFLRNGGGRSTALIPLPPGLDASSRRALAAHAMSLYWKLEGEFENSARRLHWGEEVQAIKGDLGLATYLGEQALSEYLGFSRQQKSEFRTAPHYVGFANAVPEERFRELGRRLAERKGLIV